MRLGMGRKKIRIGDVLIAAGAITEEQLQEALAYQKENGGKLGNVLVELGFISDQILITLLTQQLGIDYISLKGAKIEDSVVHRLSSVNPITVGVADVMVTTDLSFFILSIR